MRPSNAPFGASPPNTFRTTDLALAAWLCVNGHEPMRFHAPDASSILVSVEFQLDHDVRALIAHYTGSEGAAMREITQAHNRMHRLARDARKAGAR